MNPLNLSPTAALFWGSIIRHLLTFVGSALVAHGYVSQTGANAYTEELIGVIINGAVLVWSNRTAYWQRVKMLTALWMPKGTTEHEVDVHLDMGLPTPAISTPVTTIPGVPK